MHMFTYACLFVQLFIKIRLSFIHILFIFVSTNNMSRFKLKNIEVFNNLPYTHYQTSALLNTLQAIWNGNIYIIVCHNPLTSGGRIVKLKKRPTLS